jgi:hypothetical protein
VSDEQTRSLLLVVLGATVIWLWWSGEALNYVRPGLVPWLGLGGVVVALLGLLPRSACSATRHPTATATAAPAAGPGSAGCCWCRCWS